MIRVLAAIGIVGKALNSFEIVDLLYNAYNRDDSEAFGVEKAVNAGFNDIYIDAQSIINKKITALNKEIEIRAQKKAKEVVETVLDEEQKQLKELEENIENVIGELAIKAIQEKSGLKQATVDKAVKHIKNNKVKGE